MLAQSFLSATDLDITEPQREALMKTLVLLETGKLIHTPMPRYYEFGAQGFTGHFNMAGWARTAHGCGSICCIGGTAELVGNVSFLGTGTPALEQLFYPSLDGREVRYDYRAITPAQAATALRSYLTTGSANWAEAVR